MENFPGSLKYDAKHWVTVSQKVNWTQKWLLIIINNGDNLIIFKDFLKSFGTFRSNLKWPLINLACLSIDTARGGKRNWKKKSLDFSNFGEPHFGQNFEILSNNYKSFFSFYISETWFHWPMKFIFRSELFKTIIFLKVEWILIKILSTIYLPKNCTSQI